MFTSVLGRFVKSLACTPAAVVRYLVVESDFTMPQRKRYTKLLVWQC